MTLCRNFMIHFNFDCTESGISSNLTSSQVSTYFPFAFTFKYAFFRSSLPAKKVTSSFSRMHYIRLMYIQYRPG